MTYTPDPIDVSAVSLTGELTELVELLARNTHELWAQQRLAEGWTHGPRRDDERRHHPCLVPYDELSEDDKEIDRVTAAGVIKALVQLGCRIERP